MVRMYNSSVSRCRICSTLARMNSTYALPTSSTGFYSEHSRPSKPRPPSRHQTAHRQRQERGEQRILVIARQLDESALHDLRQLVNQHLSHRLLHALQILVRLRVVLMLQRQTPANSSTPSVYARRRRLRKVKEASVAMSSKQSAHCKRRTVWLWRPRPSFFTSNYPCNDC